MGDGNSANSKTVSQMSDSTSIENVQRRMILLEIAENEKSRFDDIITGAESDNGWEDCWKETENSVTQSADDVITDRSVPSEWRDEHSEEVTMSPKTLQEDGFSAPRSYYELMDLNREPVENGVRMARVPSQYQLDALSEMFIFDVPQNYRMVKMESCHQAEGLSMEQDRSLFNVDGGSTPYFVNSEYVSELLM